MLNASGYWREREVRLAELLYVDRRLRALVRRDNVVSYVALAVDELVEERERARVRGL